MAILYHSPKASKVALGFHNMDGTIAHLLPKEFSLVKLDMGLHNKYESRLMLPNEVLYMPFGLVIACSPDVPREERDIMKILCPIHKTHHQSRSTQNL